MPCLFVMMILLAGAQGVSAEKTPIEKTAVKAYQIQVNEDFLSLLQSYSRLPDRVWRMETGDSCSPSTEVNSRHWAYQAITALQQRGILIGYPDGRFKGNHALTRYEFAVGFKRCDWGHGPL